MKQIKKSVIKLSELPIRLQKNKIFKGHKLHTYAEFHIDDSEKDELSLWLIENYPTIKKKISFLIHIDSDEEIDYSENEMKQQGYSEEEVIKMIEDFVNHSSSTPKIDLADLKDWFKIFKK